MSRTIDVYSGAAFFWAEAVAFALRRLGKPYVLTLHGGGLPRFARDWPLRRDAPPRLSRCGDGALRVPGGGMRRYRADLLLIPNAIDVARYPFRLRGRLRPEARLGARVSRDLRPHTRDPSARAAARARSRRDARHGRSRQTRRKLRAGTGRRRGSPGAVSRAASRNPKFPRGSTAATSF